MDYGKMKVVELRAELQARGLDTKGKFFSNCLASGFFSHPTLKKKTFFSNFPSKTGVKAALIDRLKEALDLEEQQTGLLCFD